MRWTGYLYDGDEKKLRQGFVDKVPVEYRCVCESTVWKKASKNKGSLAGVPLPTKQKGGLLGNPKSKIMIIFKM